MTRSAIIAICIISASEDRRGSFLAYMASERRRNISAISIAASIIHQIGGDFARARF